METLSHVTRIDEETAGQRLILTDVSSQRDSSSISCLPTEIMESIFIHYTRDYNAYAHGFGNCRILPRWVNVSYVCRRWRDVALNCASLWTYHFVVSPRWTEELLARSKQAPLKIYLDSHKTPWPLNLLEKVMNHTERVQELYLCPPEHYAKAALSKISSRAPSLQTLTIWVTDYVAEPFPVPFCGDTPALRTLELKGYPMPWYSLNLSSLTSLSLYNVPYWLQQDTEDFLVILGRLPGLTCLCLERALASASGFLSSAAFHTFGEISLPHLSFLSIVGPLSTVVALLACVDFPLQMEVILYCGLELDYSLNHYVLLSSVLSKKFSVFEDQGLVGNTIRSAVMQINADEGEARFMLSKLERDCDCDYSFALSYDELGSDIPLEIIVSFDEAVMMNDKDHVISDIFCSLPLAIIQKVHVISPPISLTFWRRALGRLRNVRHIKLSNTNMPDLSMLSCTDLTVHDSSAEHEGSHATSDHTSQVLVPALEQLELHGVTFTPRPGPTSAITFPCLLNALSTRNGSPGRLTITRCKIGCCDMVDSVWSWGNVGGRVVGERLYSNKD